MTYLVQFINNLKNKLINAGFRVEIGDTTLRPGGVNIIYEGASSSDVAAGGRGLVLRHRIVVLLVPATENHEEELGRLAGFISALVQGLDVKYAVVDEFTLSRAVYDRPNLTTPVWSVEIAIKTALIY